MERNDPVIAKIISSNLGIEKISSDLDIETFVKLELDNGGMHNDCFGYAHLSGRKGGCPELRKIWSNPVERKVLLARRPELSVIEVAEALEVNFKTISEHIRRLALAGIVMKRNQGSAVRHALTSRGSLILKFLRTLE
ncbi:MAG: winged helix-turn-helix domain-containing protein [Candidatus Moraniibacteriota bacterium]